MMISGIGQMVAANDQAKFQRATAYQHYRAQEHAKETKWLEFVSNAKVVECKTNIPKSGTNI